MLFKDRNLNIAILISASCHLMLIFSIIPTFASVEIRENPAAISFLGCILEEITTVPDRTFNPEEFSFIKKIGRDGGDLKGVSLTPPEIVSHAMNMQGDKEAYVISWDKCEMTALDAHYENREEKKIRFKDFIITGPAKNRMVLYRPALPVVSIFPPHFSSHYLVSVGFWISIYGFVERPECVVSSGSSEIDRMALRYIRRWQFAPYYDEDAGILQQGLLRIRFDAS